MPIKGRSGSSHYSAVKITPGSKVCHRILVVCHVCFRPAPSTLGRRLMPWNENQSPCQPGGLLRALLRLF